MVQYYHTHQYSPSPKWESTDLGHLLSELPSDMHDLLFWFQTQMDALVRGFLGFHSLDKELELPSALSFASSLFQPHKIPNFWCYSPICAWIQNDAASNPFFHVHERICQEFPNRIEHKSVIIIKYMHCDTRASSIMHGLQGFKI